jgi:hypothetical protein
MPQFSEIVSSPIGAFAVLALAAYLEVQGDACFQSGLHHSTGTKQIGWFFAWPAVLVCTACF